MHEAFNYDWWGRHSVFMSNNQTSNPTKVERVEWTPSVGKTVSIQSSFKDSKGRLKQVPVRFPSNWKEFPPGKRLSNAKISEYARAGVYGPEEKRKAIYNWEQKHGVRVCVVQDCGQKGCFPIRTWDWLPKIGPYCPVCLAKLRTERDKEKNERKAWRESVKQEYV